jgi:3-hydroxyisobutyrate dehydrogenase-like beta-hydroxyacid dehydrogenase
MNVGFVGTGAMGLPMARNLLRKGHAVSVVVHTNRAPAEALQKEGAILAAGIQDLVRKVEAVILMLPSSREVEEIALGAGGIVPALGPGQVLIDMGTSHPLSTLKVCDAVLARGARMLDAPVSGGVAGAEAGSLSIMVGGETGIFQRCLPVLQAMGKNVSHVGANGAGHTTKLLNNLISLTNVAVMAQVFPLAAGLGLDCQKLLDVLSSSSADSWVLRNHVPKIMKRDFKPGFKVRLALKDLNLGLELGRDCGAALSLPGEAARIYQQAMEAGMAEDNNSAIVRIFEDAIGAKVGAPQGTSR